MPPAFHTLPCPSLPSKCIPGPATSQHQPCLTGSEPTASWTEITTHASACYPTSPPPPHSCPREPVKMPVGSHLPLAPSPSSSPSPHDLSPPLQPHGPRGPFLQHLRYLIKPLTARCKNPWSPPSFFPASVSFIALSLSVIPCLLLIYLIVPWSNRMEAMGRDCPVGFLRYPQPPDRAWHHSRLHKNMCGITDCVYPGLPAVPVPPWP